MTLGEFILELRERVQDLRDINGDIITDPSDDGIRWTGSQLAKIVRIALSAGGRLLSVYPSSPLLIQISASSIIGEYTGITNVQGRVVLPDDVLAVTSVLKSGGSEPYGYVKPSVFREYMVQNSQPRQSEYFYTTMYDTTNKERILSITPIENGITLIYAGIYRPEYSMPDDKDVEIFLQGADDFLLDIAERECRDREHNHERSAILDKRIYNSLGLGG